MTLSRFFSKFLKKRESKLSFEEIFSFSSTSKLKHSDLLGKKGYVEKTLYKNTPFQEGYKGIFLVTSIEEGSDMLGIVWDWIQYSTPLLYTKVMRNNPEYINANDKDIKWFHIRMDTSYGIE